MAFPNLYYKRTAATAKACYICYKPTIAVLATIDTADFFYTCPIHLTDRGFATRVVDPEPEPKKPSVSPAEIARVKQEWEEKQRQKKEKDKAQGKEDSQADGDGKNGATHNAQKDAEEKEALDAGARASVSTPEEPTPGRPTHERYILHRDIFALRTADHRKRRHTAQAKDLAPRLPGAPNSSLT